MMRFFIDIWRAVDRPARSFPNNRRILNNPSIPHPTPLGKMKNRQTALPLRYPSTKQPAIADCHTAGDSKTFPQAAKHAFIRNVLFAGMLTQPPMGASKKFIVDRR